MSQPKALATRVEKPFEFDLGDFTQEIASPLDSVGQRDEPTLTKLDFDEIELALDF
jgi:hypothetical protein